MLDSCPTVGVVAELHVLVDTEGWWSTFDSYVHVAVLGVGACTQARTHLAVSSVPFCLSTCMRHVGGQLIRVHGRTKSAPHAFFIKYWAAETFEMNDSIGVSTTRFCSSTCCASPIPWGMTIRKKKIVLHFAFWPNLTVTICCDRVSASRHMAWERQLRASTAAGSGSSNPSGTKEAAGHRTRQKADKNGGGEGDGRPSIGTWEKLKVRLEILKTITGKVGDLVGYF